ncbi:MAG: leucine-rich repeat domain-containing protein, partial [Campylobacterota bacterium]|nr:leucine-rich repeat domain-containing protein [Campylobacterota bacterium]
SGEGFEVSSEAIEDKELLKQKISEYKDSIKGIKSELEEIKEDDMYQTISSLDDWDVYFEELKSGLKAEKDRLADEARVVLEEKDSVTKTEPQIIENEDLDWMEKLWKWADEHAISKKILPRNSHDLKKLRSLSISGVDGGVNPPILLPISLPKEIGYLTDLQELEFTFCGLTELPKEIGNLKNLVDLELAWNNITKLPKEIGNLKNLKRLSVGSVISDEDWDNSPYGLNYDNCLTELPNEIYTLLNLEKLIIGHFPGGDYEGFGNRITKISKDIFNLKKLKSFELSYNNINNLTEVLPYFPNTLTSLGLTQMNLRNLPIEIGNLINLTALYLGDDYLTSIPEEICSLINLSDFWFSSNKNLILSKRQKEWINNLKIRSERQNGYILVDDNLINKVDIDTNFKKNELYNDAKFDSKANTIVAQIEDSPYANHIQNIENIKFEKIRKYCENLSKANEADEMQKQLGEKGKMYKALIYSSLEVFIEKLVGETITLCDWGCDQGIASMLVVDYIKEKQLDITVSDVLLIDDDTKVLSRAMAQVEALAQDDIKILTIKSDNNTIF